MVGFSIIGDGPSRYIKGGNFFDHLNDHHLLKKKAVL
jgi:hypothetical protein